MGYRVLFVGLLCSSLILLGNLDRGPRGLAEDKESSDARYFGDSILDAMEGTSIGAELVPLAQVREEFTEAALSERAKMAELHTIYQKLRAE
ncbi:MAG: hypothetical protein V4719_16315 [Planctomycetota bacterium]